MTVDLQREKVAVALLSVVSNAALVILKFFVGLLIGSVSVMSEAIHSGVDLLAAVIALFAVKTSSIPADVEHPYGHGKLENISGTIEALLIFMAAGWIVWEAVDKLLHGKPVQEPGWGIAVMLLSAVVNFLISRSLLKVGRKTGSMALQADAWHLRTDVYTSAGVMGGLVLIWMGKSLFQKVDLNWVDPVAAISVALLIIKAAYRLTIESGRDLLDARLPDQEEELIRRHIASFSPTVHNMHRLRTRKSGHHRFVEFHIKVDGSMSVARAHQLSHTIADTIEQDLPDTSVNIHVEPSYEAGQPDTAAKNAAAKTD